MMPKLHSDSSYDEAFAALETVLAQLENGDLPLEQALALYEEGMALSKLCQDKLAAAELRVLKWQATAAGDGAAREQTTPLTGWQDQ